MNARTDDEHAADARPRCWSARPGCFRKKKSPRAPTRGCIATPTPIFTRASIAWRGRSSAWACNPGDRVGTLCWNSHRHLELYFAVTCYGAVLHTLNLRLAPDQLAYIINHADDRVIFADASLMPLLDPDSRRTDRRARRSS